MALFCVNGLAGIRIWCLKPVMVASSLPETPTRARRFASGVGFGYLHLTLVTVVGLWLTPFLLDRIGQHDYGLWLVATQIVGYLMLLDLGVIALLPREVAFASGASHENGLSSAARVFRRIRALVIWQVPLVALAGLALWWWLPGGWEALRGPLGGILIIFVAIFPLRVFQAALQGLQDLAFLGRLQVAVWTLSTVAIVALVLAGAGLYALLAGWALLQAGTAAAAWWRMRATYPALLLPDGGQSEAAGPRTREYLKDSLWVNLSQLAQILLSGTDLLVLARLLGPGAVVPYACTAKLAIVFANHPYLLGNTAIPALSQIRASGDTPRLVQVARALSQTVLLFSGLIACAILIANTWFVSWWVGPDQYAGLQVTLAVVSAMVLRHFSFTLAQVLFCLGRQRALSLTGIADGVTAVVLMVLLIPRIGIVAAPLSQVASVSLVSLPVHGWLFWRTVGPSAGDLFASSFSLCLRILAVGGLSAGFAWLVPQPGIAVTTAALALMVLLYLTATADLALQPPLRPYLDRLSSALTTCRPAPLRLVGRLLERLPHPGQG